MSTMNLLSLWIIVIVITFIISTINAIRQKAVLFDLLLLLSLFTSLIFIILINSIISSIEKRNLIDQLKELGLSDEDNLPDKQLNDFRERIESARTTNELESILDSMAISNIRLTDSKSATFL